MENLDVMLVPVRGFLMEIGNFLPRLGVALAVLVIGWLLAKAFRFSVVKALRALNFHILTERAGQLPPCGGGPGGGHVQEPAATGRG